MMCYRKSQCGVIYCHRYVVYMLLTKEVKLVEVPYGKKINKNISTTLKRKEIKKIESTLSTLPYSLGIIRWHRNMDSYCLLCNSCYLSRLCLRETSSCSWKSDLPLGRTKPPLFVLPKL